MPSSDTPENSPALREAMSRLGIKSLPEPSRVLTFPDGGIVLVDEFLEYEDRPFLTSTDGKLWRMVSSNETTFGYTVENVSDSPARPDIQSKGSTISESDAVTLL